MSERHIASQRRFAAGLLRHGHDASQARALLSRFEELQQLHIADRNRLHCREVAMAERFVLAGQYSSALPQ